MEGQVFHYELKSSPDSPDDTAVTVSCHGKLVREHTDELKKAVEPLFARGGRIVVDLGDVNYMDSAGLGALVGLKVSATKGGHTLQFARMTPRVLELVRMTSLTQFLCS